MSVVWTLFYYLSFVGVATETAVLCTDRTPVGRMMGIFLFSLLSSYDQSEENAYECVCVWTNLLPTILTSFGVRARVHTHIWLVRLGCACSQMSANSVCTLVVHTMVVRFFQPKTVKTESEEERVIIVPTLLASFLINASIHTSKGVCDGDDHNYYLYGITFGRKWMYY